MLIIESEARLWFRICINGIAIYKLAEVQLKLLTEH